MGHFEDLVEAAANKDIWILDVLYRKYKVNGRIDCCKQQLALTPAGQLAVDGQWEAVALFMGQCQADYLNKYTRC